MSHFYNKEPISTEFKDYFSYNALYPILNNTRCLKGQKEIQALKEVCQISS